MRDLEDDLASRRTGGAGSQSQPLSDEDYKREMEKLGAVSAAADNRQRDEYAISRMRVGMGAKARGVTGFIEEIRPETGKVTVANWDTAVTVQARHVRSTEGVRFQPPADDLSDLERYI